MRAEKKNVRKDGGSGYRIEGEGEGSRVQAQAGGKGVGQSSTALQGYCKVARRSNTATL